MVAEIKAADIEAGSRRRLCPPLARRVHSRWRSNPVAFGAKRTWTAAWTWPSSPLLTHRGHGGACVSVRSWEKRTSP